MLARSLRDLRGVRSPVAAVWATAFAIRCIYLWQISHAPFFDLRLGDAEAYDAWARRIAAGDWIGSGVFYQAPLYPYFLAAVYRLIGDGVATVRVVQAFIGAASCALLASAAISLTGNPRAWIAGLLLALYPPAIFFDGLLEKSCLVTFLTCALIYVISRERWIAAGVVLGLLVLTRENALLLVFPLLLWIVTKHGNRTAVAFVGACVVVLLPVVIRNAALSGEFHLTTSQFGPNFYIGNHEGASGSYEPLVVGHGNAADEQEDATRLAEEASGHKLSPGEVSSFWTAKTLDDIRSEPIRWLRLIGRKAALTFNAAEVADTESKDVYAEWSALLRLLAPFNFGLLVAFAATAVAVIGRSAKRLAVVYVIGATYAASVVFFYVFARYRFPIVPVLCLVSVAGVSHSLEISVGLRTFAAAFAIGICAFMFAHLPLEDQAAARATHYFSIGAAFAKDPARAETAMEFYQRALHESPQFAAAQFGIATQLTRQGRNDEAVPYYRAALNSWPDHAESQYNLGVALAAGGHRAEAADAFAQAVRIRPDDADSRLAFGKTLLSLGRPSDAREQYQAVLGRESANLRALVGLGVALTQLGRTEEAIARYDEALRLDPNNADAHNSLGFTLATQGHVDEALPHFERAVQLNPNDANAQRNLEQARTLKKK